jgi:NTE family protein
MSSLLATLPAPVALVLGAGEQNCVAQAGMLAPLLADGWRPDLVVGSSGGAVTAAVLTVMGGIAGGAGETGAGGSGEGGAAIGGAAADLWRAIAASKAARPGWSRLAAAAASSASPRVDKAWRAVFDPVFGTETLDGTGCTLVATNLSRKAALPLSTGPIVDALLAAAGHPVLANPVIRDGEVIIDGGFVAPVPVLQALSAGAASLVVLDTGRPTLRPAPTPPRHWYQVTLEAIRHQLDTKASLDTERAAASVPVVLLSCAEPGWVSWNQADQRILAGRDNAEAQLSALTKRWSSITEPGVYTSAEEIRLDRRLSAVVR